MILPSSFLLLQRRYDCCWRYSHFLHDPEPHYCCYDEPNNYMLEQSDDISLKAPPLVTTASLITSLHGRAAEKHNSTDNIHRPKAPVWPVTRELDSGEYSVTTSLHEVFSTKGWEKPPFPPWNGEKALRAQLDSYFWRVIYFVVIEIHRPPALHCVLMFFMNSLSTCVVKMDACGTKLRKRYLVESVMLHTIDEIKQ